VSVDDSGPSWSDIATWYDELITAGSGPHETAVDCLLRLVPPLAGKDVLDIACGQGLATEPSPKPAPVASSASTALRTWSNSPGATVPDTTPSPPGYFDERFWRSANPNGVRRAGNQHRMLSTYLNTLARSDFLLGLVEEPEVSSLLAGRQPLYREVPIFFAARTLKK
jgi:hypothetical protein